MASDHSQVSRGAGSYDLRADRPRDSNLENLISNWSDYKTRLIVFLGSGASVGACGGVDGTASLPTAVWLRNDIWSRFMLSAQERKSFDFASIGMMTLEHASAIAESRVGRRPLVEFVASIYTTDRPLWSHLVLPLLEPTALFTTNYDPLVELGWNSARSARRIKRDLLPIFAEGQSFDNSKVPLFKPHGSADRASDGVGKGGLVITMFDYFQMLTRKRAMLEDWLSRFNATCAVFVGYSFMDMDIASHLFGLRQKDRGLHWYAIFPRGDPDVTRMYATQFGIQQINRTFFEFLVDLDNEVDFIPADLKHANILELQKSLIQ